jgi:hypothetical protein
MNFSTIFTFEAIFDQENGTTELQVYHRKFANFM